jgi:hypothetical protein
MKARDSEHTNLVDEGPNHVSLSPLQRPESSAEVELDVVLLTLHAYSREYSALRIEIQPKVMSQKVTESLRIQTQVRPSDRIMLPEEGVIAYADHNPEGAINRQIDRLVPLRQAFNPRGIIILSQTTYIEVHWSHRWFAFSPV